jgi:hypothetical protein
MNNIYVKGKFKLLFSKLRLFGPRVVKKAINHLNNNNVSPARIHYLPLSSIEKGETAKILANHDNPVNSWF